MNRFSHRAAIAGVSYRDAFSTAAPAQTPPALWVFDELEHANNPTMVVAALLDVDEIQMLAGRAEALVRTAAVPDPDEDARPYRGSPI